MQVEIEVRDIDLIRFSQKCLLPEDLNDTVPCWLWQGAKHSKKRGYGKFWMNGKAINAHKASHLLFIGPVADGLVVAHQCNVEGCVSPHHLKAETQSDNMQYCVASGRHSNGK